MAQLKKILAGSMALCMAGSMLTACGDDTSSKNDSKAAGGSDSVNTAGLHGKESSDKSKKTYTIYCWNTEFQSRFEKYYWDNRDEALWDGVEVNWVQIENEGNAYQTKLDEALKNQAESEDKVDMFLVEADYSLKYANGDVALSVQDIGITADDMAEQYKYTQDVMTDANGNIKGLSWQATPGLFLYNTDIAEAVLGSSDPETVQAAVADWDKFTETAGKMKEQGYKMVSGYDDTYRCFSNTVSSPWVTDDKVSIDPQISEWVKQTKEYTDAEYNTKSSLWDDNWKAGMKIDSGVFGYFFSTWGIPFTLLPTTVDEEIKEDQSNAVEGNGGYGKWKACAGPQAYFWGGTWLCGAIDSDNIEITKDIMLKMTCDKDIMKAITEGEQDYTNNKAAIKELIDGGYSNPFLGGQDHLSLLTEAADKIDLSNKLSAYDQGCNENFQKAMKAYYNGTSTYEEAIEAFKSNITALYANLDVSGVTAE